MLSLYFDIVLTLSILADIAGWLWVLDAYAHAKEAEDE